MRFVIIFLLLLLPFNSFSQEQKEENEVSSPEQNFTKNAKLKALNKVTAMVSILSVEKDKQTNFGNLVINLDSCWKSPPEEEPESKALLSIWEQIPGEDKKKIFEGWMFASSPALSAMENPVYDISVIECYNQ